MNKFLAGFLVMTLTGLACAKIPPPVLSDEDKAKAAEAAAKAAHGGKVANYQLCRSMDATAAHYFKTAKAAGKDPKPAAALAPCADPGPFAAASTAPATAAAPAAAVPAAVVVPAKPAPAASAKKS